MQLLSIVVLVKGITVKRGKKIPRILSIYTGASLIQSTVSIVTWGYNDPVFALLPIFSLPYFIFIFIEATCCYALIMAANIQPRLVTFIRVVLFLFLAFGIFYLCQVPYEKWNINMVGIAELPIIILLCATYYYHLLTQPPQPILLKQPLFWAVSGMAVMAFCLIPFSLVYEHISRSKILSHLGDIIPSLTYILSYCFYLKAIKCSQKQPEL